MKLKKGLDLPITGAPVQTIHEGPKITKVAVNGRDFIGLKPKMLVAEGDKVKKGQPLFLHKASEDVFYVAPGAGTIVAINRGERRVLETIVIALDDVEEEVTFETTAADKLSAMPRETVQKRLYESGQWTFFKTRPYSYVPLQDTVPHSIFVTAMDTDPLAADPAVVIAENDKAFTAGVDAISNLTDGHVYVCHAPEAKMPGVTSEKVVFETFEGPHPAGLAGTHIHFLDPVSANKTVWSISYADVIAIGNLFLTGKIDTDRVISLCGPLATNPRLVKTRAGASTDELTAGEIETGIDCRVISGSVLSGVKAEEQFAFLSRSSRQITLIEEDHKQRILGWGYPSMNYWSFNNVHLSSLLGGDKKFAFGTNQRGGRRAMVPFGSYERVMPMDVLPTQLLRALLTLDTDLSQKLGALELDEEDLALCTFICHSKYEYGEALRANLVKIEKEG
ncbi:Na(+)-translocating NADH-quinone reductase subunit A [uncultured Cohaesibacter sp.]|uniref:Na(+)-translocating NADH-quinone reductase subunit A n=1 Tax=uncultured Cohaesibacter sp. TaxID=1002546 RepID=UPI002931D8A3|nr:Na(+)-translocating NADH-quinone reductase subunit A [uncultured Cohaesibacter sp.]